MNPIPQGLIPVSEVLAYLSQDRYLSLSEAASYIGLSERTIRKLLLEIPHFRIGSKLLFRKSELDAWILQYREQGAELDLNRIAHEVLEGFFGSNSNRIDQKVKKESSG